ncbi:MAG: DNA-3-methyladenine glycosylase I [Pirellulales bacterium]|nr:DNA-3-methyladenine glycosylase I [Pirellulales bacterium]
MPNQTNPAAPDRCSWPKSQLMLDYHDQEWGVPLRDDRGLFEFLALSGVQAGLSWEIVLRKREAFRKAFDKFEPARVARYSERRLDKLLANTEIVRNRAKLVAIIKNARGVLAIQEKHGSFADYLWGFVDGRAVVNRWQSRDELPASSPLSDRVSKEMKARGFQFVGTTICYAYMQSVGVVNDHLASCFRHAQVGRKPRAAAR